MELVVHLNSLKYVDDFLDMGVKMFVTGSENFSCRQALSLTYQQIINLKDKTTSKAKIYVLVNALIEEKYVEDLKSHLKKLHELDVDGILFQDFGVLHICQSEQYKFDLMYAPDTLNTNQETLNFLATKGIKSAFLAREIPLNEKIEISNNIDIKTVIQVHGVEYMAYSKRRLLTNYFKMAKIDINPSIDNNLSINAKDVEDKCHIYEDKYGTHILTMSQIACLDVLDKMIGFDYLFIESLYLDEVTLLEVVRLYLQAISTISNNTYKEKVKELKLSLDSLNPKIKYHHSFMFDQTVYKIADVRKREDDGNN